MTCCNCLLKIHNQATVAATAAAAMSSVELLRDFVSGRLMAQEIFEAIKQTIFEYEEKIDRQRSLLDNTRKPQNESQLIGR